MPFSFEGIGTAYCPAAGHVYWGAEADYDAVECFVVLYIPLYPFRAVHVYDHKLGGGLVTLLTGFLVEKYQHVPIEYQRSLFWRALFRRASPLFWFLGVLGVMFGILGERVSDAWKYGLGAAGAVMLVAIALSSWLVWSSDRRNRDIRYVLGRHEAGSSDPAAWTEALLEVMPGPRKLFGTKTFAEAVPVLLDDRQFSRAMWAARLCTALEDHALGQRLTDDVLENRRVRKALAKLKSQTGGKSFQLSPAVDVNVLDLWEQLMTGGAKPAPTAKKRRRERDDTAD